MKVYIEKLSPDVYTPEQAYPFDVGWDLRAAEQTVIYPGEKVDVPCGFKMALPAGFYARITGRSSSLRKHNILVGEGIIDAGYRGPIYTLCYNLNDEPYTVKLGQALAQMIIARVEDVTWMLTNELPPSARGENGFGSSG